MTEDDDASLRGAMQALRVHDEAAAPPFVRVHAAAVRRAERRRGPARVLALSGAVALAAVVLLALWLGRTPPSLGPAPSFEGTEPLAFLLEPPSASVLDDAHVERSF